MFPAAVGNKQQVVNINSKTHIEENIVLTTLDLWLKFVNGRKFGIKDGRLSRTSPFALGNKNNSGTK